jgi:hypothetical protein
LNGLHPCSGHRSLSLSLLIDTVNKVDLFVCWLDILCRKILHCVSCTILDLVSVICNGVILNIDKKQNIVKLLLSPLPPRPYRRYVWEAWVTSKMIILLFDCKTIVEYQYYTRWTIKIQPPSKTHYFSQILILWTQFFWDVYRIYFDLKLPNFVGECLAIHKL